MERCFPMGRAFIDDTEINVSEDNVFSRGSLVKELPLFKCGQHGANSFEEHCDIILITNVSSMNSI